MMSWWIWNKSCFFKFFLDVWLLILLGLQKFFLLYSWFTDSHSCHAFLCSTRRQASFGLLSLLDHTFCIWFWWYGFHIQEWFLSSFQKANDNKLGWFLSEEFLLLCFCVDFQFDSHVIKLVSTIVSTLKISEKFSWAHFMTHTSMKTKFKFPDFWLNYWLEDIL